jgi:uncharacterized membrane protein (UPF0127 family)
MASVSSGPFPTTEITIDNTSLEVWVADDAEERQRGLMGIESLPTNIDGVLFVWAEPGSASFHMKDTAMALDIWWFDNDGMLLGSNAMEPCESDPCPRYGSPGGVRWVLETPQDEQHFAPGDRLSTGENG